MTEPRSCEHCGGSLAGKRRHARFCRPVCRALNHRSIHGRADEVPSHYLIGKSMRDALIEVNDLNMQDEGDPAKVREAFLRMCERFVEKFA